MSYEQYRSAFGGERIDPRGATNIFRHSVHERDGYDVLERLQIEPAAYQRLLIEMEAKMRNPKYVLYDGKAAGPVRVFRTKSKTLPNYWPEFDTQPPDWWDLSMISDPVDCTRWEVQVSSSAFEDRACGWMWMYDRHSKTLFIWEWNRQHLLLPNRTANEDIQMPAR